MKTAIASIAAAASILSLATSQVAFAQSGFQVLRTGDSELTCEALVTEINGLNQTVRQQAERAQRNAQTRQTAGRVGRGLLSGLARGAQVFAYGSTSTEALGGLVASSAASGVAQEIANGASQPAQPPQPLPAVDTPEQHRLTHLTGIHGQRC